MNINEENKFADNEALNQAEQEYDMQRFQELKEEEERILAKYNLNQNVQTAKSQVRSFGQVPLYHSGLGVPLTRSYIGCNQLAASNISIGCRPFGATSRVVCGVNPLQRSLVASPFPTAFSQAPILRTGLPIVNRFGGIQLKQNFSSRPIYSNPFQATQQQQFVPQKQFNVKQGRFNESGLQKWNQQKPLNAFSPSKGIKQTKYKK